MDVLLKILITYGPWGLLLLCVLYMVLSGEFVFKYPRSRKK